MVAFFYIVPLFLNTFCSAAFFIIVEKNSFFFYDSLQHGSVRSVSDNNIKPRTPLAQPTGHTDSTATGFISTGGYQASNTIYTLQIS